MDTDVVVTLFTHDISQHHWQVMLAGDMAYILNKYEQLSVIHLHTGSMRVFLIYKKNVWSLMYLFFSSSVKMWFCWCQCVSGLLYFLYTGREIARSDPPEKVWQSPRWVFHPCLTPKPGRHAAFNRHDLTGPGSVTAYVQYLLPSMTAHFCILTFHFLCHGNPIGLQAVIPVCNRNFDWGQIQFV